MAFTDNPAGSLIDRFRLKVGDTDIYDEVLSDSTYEYILSENDIVMPYDLSTEIPPAAIVEALTYMVNKFANFSHEEAGDLEIWDERYDRYKQLLDKYLKDPRYGFSGGNPFAGGISKSDIEANKANSDNNLTKPFEGWLDLEY